MDKPIIAIDTRERLPYDFPLSQIKTLKTGDYSIIGLEDRVAVERKTTADAFSSLGRYRSRFRAEVERLSNYGYAAIVVEASIPDLLKPPPFSRMNPKAVINSLLGWSVRYGVNIIFAGDRQYGNAITRTLLEKYWKYYGDEVNDRIS
ncbi:MAG: hypothetical protein KJ970_13855 [Candidatus Eisenbacteria bacterium]|uniref:ERCC4 domain-containing protein n=1 Tax=Eiseniibacteriota bacterium TaxID=2212470 RepID=A0A948RVW5_UNCEI|nr:hypothetical protein [Candidatus Eisenbacteria bacterium]MBU1950037.1 hypothetical protein [Candidatus Eisenbacteria bacterium]MBU2692000.1 hypothetical protein [Candidatus Eisenbacteria bacterium]